MTAEALSAPFFHAAQHAPGGTDELFFPEQIVWTQGESGRTVRSNVAKNAHLASTFVLSTGVMYVFEMPLKAGDVINYLGFRSSTGATSPTNWWFALYDDSKPTSAAALLAQSADQLTASWTSNVTKFLQLASTVTIPRNGRYRQAVMMAAATPVTLVGPFTQQGMHVNLSYMSDAVMQGTKGSGLTGTAPANLSGLTANIGNNSAVMMAVSGV